MENKYPPNWVIPSNATYDLIDKIFSVLLSYDKKFQPWCDDVKRTVDVFLEENSVELESIIEKYGGKIT